MIFRTILGLLVVLMVCSCAQQTSKGEMPTENDANLKLKPKSGLKIEYGSNLGAIDKYSAGDYIFITATITNDSIIPIHLHVAISEEFDFPDSCSDNQYKVFLLPKELTPDTATLYNNITDGVSNFLDKCLDNPYVLNKTLEPGEFSVITIGTLLPRDTKCSVAALPRAIFAQSDGHSFQACDSRMNQGKSPIPITPIATEGTQQLGIKFVFYRGKSQPETCILHPCGQISYPEQ